MNRMYRVQSAQVIKKQDLQNQMLLEDAYRLLDNLQVVASLSKFKEYIERMRVQFGDQFPQFQTIIEQLCHFAISLQKNSGKSDLSILILQYLQDIAKGTSYIKIIQQSLATVYKFAGHNLLEVTEKKLSKNNGLLSPKQLQISKSEVKIKSFYYQNNIKQLSDMIDQQPKQQKKQFVIKNVDKKEESRKSQIQENKPEQKILQASQQVPIQQDEQENNKFDWSSSEDEDQKPITINEAVILEEKRQKEIRIKFLLAELNMKFEARVIEIKKSKDEIVYPIQAIIRLQSHQRRKIAQRRRKALEALRKREELQKRYEELIRKIQNWFRAIRIRRKFRDLAYTLLDLKRRTINPKKQQKSAILIQRCIRKCIVMKRFKRVNQADDNKIRQKVITFNIKEVSDKIQNKLFFFIMRWEEDKIIIKLSVYAKKKCDRLLIKPFILEFNEKQFWFIFARLIEYIDQLKAEIEPNQNYLRILQNCQKIGQNIVITQVNSYKLLKKKMHIIKQLGQIEFEELLYMDQHMKLELAGFTDFQYSDNYQQAEATQRNIINNIKQLKESEKLIILVQGIFKQRKAINIMRAKVNRRRHINSQFGLSFKQGYAQVFINTKDEIFARVIYQRKWMITNKLKLSPMITKQLGYPCRENFFDIYQFQEDVLTYTEEGMYWITKEQEVTKKKKTFSFSQIEGCIRIIQSCVRKHLTLKQVMVKRKNQQIALENKTRILVKKVVLSGSEPTRGYFMTFGVDINEQQEATSIAIDVRSLEHSFQTEYIHPYRQPLYDKISIDELTIIGQKMIQIGEVKQVKGQMRFHVRNLMEVQGLLLNDQDFDAKKNKAVRDDTLQARKLWNQHMRKSWIRAIDVDISIPSSESCAFKRIGKKKFNAFASIQSYQSVWKRDFRQKLKDSIDVKPYDQESISDYVRQYQYKSEYGYGENVEEGYYNVNFLEIRKQEKDEQEEKEKKEQQDKLDNEKRQKEEDEKQKKLLRDSLFVLYQEYNVISQQRIYIRIIYNKLENILEIKGKTEQNLDLICIINIIDVLSIEVELEYLKETLKRSVVKQLYLEGGKLNFDCDPKIQEILLTEYLIWQRLQTRQPKLSNVEGSIYNLRDLFVNLKIELSMYDNLVENGYQIYQIRSNQIQDRRHEYLFNLSCSQVIFTIYFDDQPEKYKTHIIPANLFECRYLTDVIANDPPESIAKILIPTFNYLDEHITINHDYTTNFIYIQPYLSRIFKEQMVIRLQRRLKIHNQYHYYLQYRKRSQQNIFLAHRYIVLESRYIKVIFFLSQYIIKMVFQQLNSIDPQQPICKFKKVYYINLLEQTLESFNETKEKWIENQGIRMPRYYQQTYKPFIEYILTRIRIEQPFEIVFGNEFKVTQTQNTVDRSKTDTMFYNMIDAIIKLQVHYKTFKQREVYNLTVSKTDKSLIRQIGKLFSRSIKVIQDEQYLVNMYRIIQGVETQITVDLINFSKRKNKYRGIYILDSTEMLNIGQQKISEYILNMVYITDGLLQFQSSQFTNIDKISNIDETTRSPTLKLETSVVENNQLINHYEQPSTENNLNTVYNVTYTGSVKQKQINQSNTVQISVDLSNFKKLYPCLHQNDSMAMKKISDSIIESVQVNKQGQVQVNVARINPSLIQIENNQIEGQEIEQPKIKPESLLVLAKKITYFAKRKFLMKISILERKVTKIQEDPADAVEQHYESLYQVVAMSLEKQNKDDAYIEWELSSEDAQQLTHQKQQKKIAQELSKRTLIVQGKFIFLAIDKVDIQRHHYPNCILFLEKGIKPIQRQFRNRKRLLNFREYKYTVKQWKDSAGNFPAYTSLYLDCLASDQQFIVLSGEDKSKRIMLICWNLDTFDKLTIEIPKQQYQKLLMKNKGLTIKLLTSYVEYKDFNLYFKPPQLSVIQTKIDNSSPLNIMID